MWPRAAPERAIRSGPAARTAPARRAARCWSRPTAPPTGSPPSSPGAPTPTAGISTRRRSSRCSSPTPSTTGRCRSTGTGERCATTSSSRTTAVASTWHCGRASPGEDYNIGAGREINGITVADTVLRLLGKPPDLKQFVSDRPGHDRRYALDAAKLRAPGLGAAGPLRAGDGADGPLVRGERGVVAAAQEWRVLGVLPAELQAGRSGRAEGSGPMRIEVIGSRGQLGRELMRTLAGPPHRASGHDVEASTSAIPIRSRHCWTRSGPTRSSTAPRGPAWTRPRPRRPRRQRQRRRPPGPRRGVRARGLLLCHLSTDYVFDGAASRAHRRDRDAPTRGARTGGESWPARRRCGRSWPAIRSCAPRGSTARRGPTSCSPCSARRRARGPPGGRRPMGLPTWTGHLAPAIVRLVERGVPGTFHLTNAGSTTWHGFAEAVVEEAGLQRPGDRDQHRRVPDRRAPARLLGAGQPRLGGARRGAAAPLAGGAALLPG